MVSQMVKNLPAVQKTHVQYLDQEDPMEEGPATHSSSLASRIPWTEEPGRLQSMGPQRVGHNWATNTHTQTQTHTQRHTHTHTTWWQRWWRAVYHSLVCLNQDPHDLVLNWTWRGTGQSGFSDFQLEHRLDLWWHLLLTQLHWRRQGRATVQLQSYWVWASETPKWSLWVHITCIWSFQWSPRLKL